MSETIIALADTNILLVSWCICIGLQFRPENARFEVLDRVYGTISQKKICTVPSLVSAKRHPGAYFSPRPLPWFFSAGVGLGVYTRACNLVQFN